MKRLLVLFALVALVSAGCAKKEVTRPEAEKPAEKKEAAEKVMWRPAERAADLCRLGPFISD